jgi:hypothetical protein
MQAAGDSGAAGSGCRHWVAGFLGAFGQEPQRADEEAQRTDEGAQFDRSALRTWPVDGSM